MRTILWDLADGYGAVFEPADRKAETFDALGKLGSAETLGELRNARLPEWARSVVESFEDRVLDELDADVVPDDTAWDTDPVWELIVDLVPLPWDYRCVVGWLDAETIHRFADVGGASPGGHIDTVTVRDPSALVAHLEASGYACERYEGLLKEYWSAL